MGSLVIGVPLIYQGPLFQSELKGVKHLLSREKTIFKAFYEVWTESWPERDKDAVNELDGVLNVVRFDKRKELLLAIRLLSYGPACFFLTGYLSPWNDPSKVKDVLNRWQVSQSVVERKLYFGFSSFFAAAYYNGSDTWKLTGYPGPPEVEKGSAL